MNSSLLWMLILLAISVIIILLCFKSGLFGNGDNIHINRKNKSEIEPKSNCPICNSPLYQGENIISRVYKGTDKTDQACTILGCTHCYPKLESGVKRICPVCHKEVAQDQSLTARLFNKALGKKHVHVVGCSNCHKPRAD